MISHFHSKTFFALVAGFTFNSVLCFGADLEKNPADLKASEFGQETHDDSKSLLDQVDFSGGFEGRLFYDRINLSLYLTNNALEQTELEYFTQTEWIVGGALSKGPIGLSLSHSIRGTNGAKDTDGRTDLAAYRFEYSAKRHAVEIYHYSFKGFGLRNSKDYKNATISGPAPFDSKILAHSSGVHYTFIKSPKDFAFPGKLSGKRPDESGISFLADAQLNGFNVEGDGALIPETERSKFGSKANVEKLGTIKIYGGPGFGGSVVLDAVDLSMAIYLNLGARFNHDSSGPEWIGTSGVSIPSRLGARFIKDELEAGVFGVFENEGRSTKKDLNFGWYQSMIETYISYKF